ncbi:MAG: hypothetical protein QOI73_2403 [Solirubrobacteraceae bacterium]|nr:hypothetical protein [Solirubrobacteraceae bacterium]
MRLLALIAVVAVGLLWYVAIFHPNHIGPSVRRYCEYGSMSEPQFAGCLEHVTSKRIESLHTHAAQFAKGELAQCLADAGPICDDTPAPDDQP